MKTLGILVSALAAGIAAVAAVLVFYRKSYVKWKYYTLYED